MCGRRNGYKLIMVENRNMPEVLDLTKRAMNYCVDFLDLPNTAPSKWFGPLLNSCSFVVVCVCPMVWEQPPLSETNMSPLCTVNGQAQHRLYEVCVN